jgi:hypothetical protein
VTQPNRRKRRLSDHLTIAADALVLSVLAGAVFIMIKDYLAIPAAWIDPLLAFLITMALSSTAGAVAAWLIHRHSSGFRGLLPLCTGLLVAVGAVYATESLVLVPVASSLAAATPLFIAAQVTGLLVMLALFAGGAVDLLRHRLRRLHAVGLVRLAALASLMALVAFRFIPDSQADPIAAQLYAFIGLATVAGAVGVALGDTLLRVISRRAHHRSTDTA